MAYQIDPSTGDIVIGGFEKGIGDSPYSGITDMRSVDPTSIPGEVSIAFQTTGIFKTPQVSNQAGTLTTGAGGGLFNALSSFNMEQNQTITFSDIGTAVGAGLAIGTPYKLFSFGVSAPNNQWQLFTGTGAQVTISNAGNVVFSTVNPSKINYIQYDGSNYYALDSAGFLWGSGILSAAAGNTPATNSWCWLGNPTTNASGNGLAYFNTPNSNQVAGDGWIFVFRNQAIDYAQVYNGSFINAPTWVVGWNPNTGTSGSLTVMQNAASHQAIVAPDGNLYFLNSSSNAVFSGSVGKIQANWTVPGYTAFRPDLAPSTTNYSYADFPIIPKGTTPNFVTCMEPSGTNILIAGPKHFIYNWDTISRAVSNYIYIAETNVVSMVTANQNTYVFAGNRGNIYITNGSQAQVWKKIPDHLSGSVYPVFTFYGATYQKGRLYFGISGIRQDNVAPTSFNMGGVWSIDLDTGALRCANQLSYGTYAGFATAFYNPNENTTTNTPPGNQLYIGWSDGTGNLYGIDVTAGTPYSAGQSYIISDAIPIGTILKPNTPLQFEYKLAAPLLTGESVEIQVAPYYGASFTSLGTTAGLTSSTILSDIFPSKVQELQWLLVKAILTASSGTSVTPSYNRLVQLRVIGSTIPQTGYQNLQ